MQVLQACWLGTLVLAAAWVLVPMAVWAVQYALLTQQRGRLLLYWAGLLLAALPAMDWLARASHVPTILVRKVSCKQAHICCQADTIAGV